MPAFYAHLRFGEEVTQLLPAPFQNLISTYPEAFALGTQGPDILFYHQPMKQNDIRRRGTYLHSLSGETFFAEQAKKMTIAKDLEELLTKNGAFAAYICGFLCHFTLDTLCHPFINEHSNEEVSHGKIESEFDKYVRKQSNKPVRGYNAAGFLTKDNGTSEACALTVEVPKEEIDLSIKTMRKINGWFSKKSEAFHFVMHTLLKIVGAEKKFGDMFLHKQDDPLCEPLNEVLYEKFIKGKEKASAFIQEYFHNLASIQATGVIENDFFRYNFSGIK